MDPAIRELLKEAKKDRDSRVRFSDIDTHVPHPSDLGSSPTFQKSKVAKKNSLLSKTFNAPVSMAETSPATTDTEDTTSGEEDEDIELTQITQIKRPPSQ